jgi:hypothetical protein
MGIMRRTLDGGSNGGCYRDGLSSCPTDVVQESVDIVVHLFLLLSGQHPVQSCRSLGWGLRRGAVSGDGAERLHHD